jgi:alkyl hydroperoxide reductase subunit AhpF
MISCQGCPPVLQDLNLHMNSVLSEQLLFAQLNAVEYYRHLRCVLAVASFWSTQHCMQAFIYYATHTVRITKRIIDHRTYQQKQ